MKLSHHPEYTKYLQDHETVQRCEQAVAAWRAENASIFAEAYGISWTCERALGFVCSLLHMFEAYNKTLWEQFSYCRACGGGCCVLDASHVGPFDGIALALLGLPLPALPDAIATTVRGCVYLDGRQCTLPTGWRTTKCWSFYCLGGRWEPGASLGEHHGALAGALKRIVLDRLPEELRRYERVRGDSLIAHLDDPTDFAQALDDALFEILVEPLHARFPLLGPMQAEDTTRSGDARPMQEDVLAFVSRAMEHLFGSDPADLEDLSVSPDQFLADLELLEWIAVGRPSNQVQLLSEMRDRYVGLPYLDSPEQSALERQLLDQVALLLDALDTAART
jgi:hypothetical protein